MRLSTPFLALALCLSLHSGLWAQPTATPSPEPTVSTTPESLSRAIPLAEVITQSEAVSRELEEMRQAADGKGTLLALQSQIRDQSEQMVLLQAENEQTSNSLPSLDTLRALERDWRPLGQAADSAQTLILPMLDVCERELPRLSELHDLWSETLRTAAAQGAPEEVLTRIRTTQDSIATTRDFLEKRQKLLLSLQSRVAEQAAGVQSALDSFESIRQQAVVKLFYQDSPPLWQAKLLQSGLDSFREAVESSSRTQWSELIRYTKDSANTFFLHALLIGLLWGLARWARGTVAVWAKTEPTLERVAAVFQRPMAMAVLVSLAASGWLYPQAPPMAEALLGLAALLPTLLILRRLVESQLLPVLNVLVVFYLMDQLRLVVHPIPALARILFLLQMLGGLAFCGLLIFRETRMPGEQDAPRLVALLKIGLRLGAIFFLAASLSNILGYLNLAYLVGNAVLRSAYFALILYAAVRVGDGLLLLSLRIRPLCLLQSVTSNRLWLRLRLQVFLRWAAVALWTVSFLEMLSQRSRFAELLAGAWNAGFRLGALHVTLGSLVAFAAILWGASLFSRVLRLLLQQDIYPRMELARGVPYAISTASHYTILVIGCVLAMAAAGIDMTRFTILAGAFSVGLGFGLQTIVNNFVSGLILLLERPVKIGDFVQVGDLLGRVEQIGIRASVVRTRTSAEVIVPNSKLISESVTNWTLSSRQRGIEIPVGVGCESNPEQVLQFLLEVAGAHPDIAQVPKPSAYLLEFGADTLNFELIAYTDVYESWQRIRSELMVAIFKKFNEKGISMPFPQRDIHLHSVPPNTIEAADG